MRPSRVLSAGVVLAEPRAEVWRGPAVEVVWEAVWRDAVEV